MIVYDGGNRRATLGSVTAHFSLGSPHFTIPGDRRVHTPAVLAYSQAAFQGEFRGTEQSSSQNTGPQAPSPGSYKDR